MGQIRSSSTMSLLSSRAWPVVSLAAILAVRLLAGPPAATADDFRYPEAGQLPARAELPEPLVMFDGRPVTGPEQWVRERRHELKALFQYYMYGQMPTPPPLQSA